MILLLLMRKTEAISMNFLLSAFNLQIYLYSQPFQLPFLLSAGKKKVCLSHLFKANCLNPILPQIPHISTASLMVLLNYLFCFLPVFSPLFWRFFPPQLISMPQASKTTPPSTLYSSTLCYSLSFGCYSCLL